MIMDLLFGGMLLALAAYAAWFVPFALIRCQQADRLITQRRGDESFELCNSVLKWAFVGQVLAIMVNVVLAIVVTLRG